MTEISNYQKGLEGHSPLTLAAKLNLKNTVKALLDNSANLNYQIPFNHNSALHYAVFNSNIELVKLIISHKARIDLRNKSNKNPIEIATEVSNTEIYALLANEMNKLNEEKEKIIQDIVKNEDIISQQNIMNSSLGKSGHEFSSKKFNKKNKKENKDVNQEKENNSPREFRNNSNLII